MLMTMGRLINCGSAKWDLEGLEFKTRGPSRLISDNPPFVLLGRGTVNWSFVEKKDGPALR
jgi:hypothetical protein